MALTGRAALAALTGTLVILAFRDVAALVVVNGLLLAAIAADVALAAPIRPLLLSRGGETKVLLGQSAVVTLAVVNPGRRLLRADVRDAWPPSAGADPHHVGVRVPAGGPAAVTTTLTPAGGATRRRPPSRSARWGRSGSPRARPGGRSRGRSGCCRRSAAAATCRRSCPASARKASFESERYRYEDKLANDRRAAPGAKKGLDALARSSTRRPSTLAMLKKQQSALLAEVDRINARKNDLETSIEKKTSAFRLSRSKYASLQQDALFQLRNAAILDMINPSLRVQQVQLPDQFINVNFMKIPKVDRCTTCHIAPTGRASKIRRSSPSSGRIRASTGWSAANPCTPRRRSAARPATADATARRRSGPSGTRRRRSAKRRRGRRSTTGSSTASTRTRCCRSSSPRPAATAATRAR